MSGTQVQGFRPLQYWSPDPGIRLRLTVEQFHRMVEAGDVPRDEPWELIDGQVVYKDRSAAGEAPMTIGTPHSVACSKLVAVDRLLAGRGCFMRVQDVVTLPPFNEPEPDGAIVRGEPDDYVDRQPNAEDVLCAIEVADSSLRRDRTTKLEAYASTGVPMYVILNLIDRQAEVHREPDRGAGRYRRSDIIGVTGLAILPTADGEQINVALADLLPVAQ